MILGAVRDRLLLSDDLRNLIGRKLYPQSLPQGETVPAADMRIVATAANHHLKGNVGVYETVVTIDCYAEELSTADQIAKQIIKEELLDSYVGEIGDFFFHHCHHIRGPVHSMQLESPSSETIRHVSSVTFEIMWSELHGSGRALVNAPSQGQTGGIAAAQGFIDYNDASTSASPLPITASTWTAIPNDGLGAYTNKTYSPDGVSEFMDTSSGKIDPRALSLGDIILIRNDFSVTPSTNNASIKFRYTLGSGGGAYTLEKRLGRLDEGSGVPYRFSLSTDKIYMGDTNTRNSLIGMELFLSTAGTLVNAGSVISLVKRAV